MIFVLYFYVKHCFRSHIAVSTPKLDLKLVKEALREKKYNPVLSEAAVNVCHMQGRYLSQDLVPLYPFDNTLCAKEKDLIATTLMRYICKAIDCLIVQEDHSENLFFKR